MNHLILKTFLLSSFFLFAFSKPLTINIPPDHGSLGTLNPPPVLDPTLPSTVWTIINNSNCPLLLKMWFSKNGELGAQYINVTLTPGDTRIIGSEELLALFNHPPGTTTLTNSSMQIFRMNADQSLTSIGYGYPDMDRRESNGLEGPCNCVHVNWNQITKTIIISNC